MTKIRLVAMSLQPHLVVDDGIVLRRLPVDPIVIEAEQWPNVIDIINDAIAKLQAQMQFQTQETS